MKKIVFFIHNMFAKAGTERVTTIIANELSKYYEVEILSLYKTAQKPFFDINKNIKVNYIFEMDPLPIKSGWLKNRKKVKAFLGGYKNVDIFICVDTSMMPYCVFLNKYTRVMVWEHFNSNFGKVGGFSWLGRKLASKHDIETIVLTKKDLKINQKRFKTKRVYQIYNPVEFEVPNTEYDINSKQIISVGRINIQKGFDMIPSFAKEIFDKHPDWQWHIYGDCDNEEGEKLKKAIKDVGLEKNVILKGVSNKIKEVYPKYSFYVLTSRFEGFAMVSIEAHSFKLPIVSFDCECGPDEIIQDGINGYLVDCFNTKEMAQKINYLIEHPDERKKMSDNTSLDKDKLMLKNVVEEWKKVLG